MAWTARPSRSITMPEALALECKPRMIVTGATAYSRLIDFARFKQIADRVGAYLMADIAHIAGLIATGLHPGPIPFADVVTAPRIRRCAGRAAPSSFAARSWRKLSIAPYSPEYRPAR